MKTKRFISTLLPLSAFAGDNSADIFLNTGTVNTNYAAIDTNHGVVEINEGGIDTNSADGEYPGTVKINNGIVEHNLGTVEENNGKVNRNHEDGIVTTNYGTVETNDGTVETNTTTGTVSNKSGTVTTNYGTVNKLEYDREVSKWVIDETWYGVQVDNDGTKTLEEYCTPGQVLDFSQLTKAGYEYAGYTQEYQLLDGVLTKQALTVSDTSYTVTCPNVLTLIWRATFSPAADDGSGSFGPAALFPSTATSSCWWRWWRMCTAWPRLTASGRSSFPTCPPCWRLS